MDTAYMHALFVTIDIDNILNIYKHNYIYMCTFPQQALAMVWLCDEHCLDACMFDGCGIFKLKVLYSRCTSNACMPKVLHAF